MNKAGRKISQLFDKKSQKKLSKIKDYAKVNEIFLSYIREHYFYMSKEIFFYSDFWFFHDLVLYLKKRFRTDNIREFFYRDMVEQYLAHYEEVLWRKR